jgi:hypothetical protein
LAAMPNGEVDGRWTVQAAAGGGGLINGERGTSRTAEAKSDSSELLEELKSRHYA